MRTTGPGIFIWIALLLALQGKAQFYAGSQMEFGKNRIQYHPFDWSFFRYERFDVYFYAGGKETALNVARAAGNFLPALEQRFDYGIENRLQILIFNRLSDLKQSNIGTGVESVQSLGGTARQSGNKLFLFMEEGNSGIFKHLREGIATVLVSELLYGTDFRDKVRSSAFMSIPEWYFKGLISWMAEGWNTKSENLLRDGLRSGRYQYPGRLGSEDAAVAGSSIWNYITSVYGEKLIADMLDMTHMSRNIEGGFKYVLGLQSREVLAEWLQYYARYFAESDSVFEKSSPENYARKFALNTVITQVKISPDAKHAAWVENKQGRAVVCIVSAEGGKLKKVIRTGHRLPDITDLSFPLLAWHPGNELLVYTDEFRGRIRLNFYHVQSGQTERKFLEFFTKVSGIDISPDGRRILMTAVRNGKSDLFVFNNVSNTIEQISDDGFDERDARWFPDGISMIFSSNRTTDSLKTGIHPEFINMKSAGDLFLYHPSRSRHVCQRLSNTPTINETCPIPVNSRRWVYLSDRNGIVNRYLGETDSAVTHVDTLVHYRYFMQESPLTNRSGNVLMHDVHPDGLGAEVYLARSRFRFRLIRNILTPFQGSMPITAWGKSLQESSLPPRRKAEEEVKPQGKVRKIVVFGKDRQQDPLNPIRNTKTGDTLRTPRQRVYFTSWYTDQFSTRIDRSFLNQSYQPYTGQAGYINPPLNGLFKIGQSDLFEYYRITAGIRLAGNFSGNEYLLAFQDQKERLDKTYSFHRQGIQNSVSDDTRMHVHTLTARLSWPFSPIARISGSLAYRNDRKVYLSTDLSSLRKPTEISHWAQPKLEFVFDNTFPLSQNMMTGTRLKFTAEFFIRPGSSAIAVGVIGADIRHYLKLARETILALRLAGAGSFGTGRLLFYLGGVDNWMSPAFTTATPVDESRAYVFQTLATNMRGFSQNIRNGNNFGVLNVECRWNPIRFFSRYPVKSDFLNALQLVSFFDMGTAYTGPQPWSEKNSFNQTTIQNGPITVILKNLNNPLVYGAGLGLRARIFGYFVRFDYARGLLNDQWQPRMLYLSLCTDF